jgi:hypothetical protein
MRKTEIKLGKTAHIREEEHGNKLRNRRICTLWWAVTL